MKRIGAAHLRPGVRGAQSRFQSRRARGARFTRVPPLHPAALFAYTAVLVALLLSPSLGAKLTQPGSARGLEPLRSLLPFAASNSSWPTYLGGVARDAAQLGERTLTPADASQLRPLWNFTAGGGIYSAPTVAGGTVYFGANDGYEYALNAANGSLRWATYLGKDTLGRYPVGVSSSATVALGRVYVGGGDARWYALDAGTGKIIWNVSFGNTSQGYFDWSSPLVANGAEYVGIASLRDAPLVFGGLAEISLASHRVRHFLNTTANGTLGASIWTSPSLDAFRNLIFTSTGNPGPNGSVWAESLLAVNATTLAVVDHWTVPKNQRTIDGDFGATPTLFTPMTGHPMVAAANKNGMLYAWNQRDLDRGPIWSRWIAYPSGSVGQPNLGPSSWGGGRLYSGSSATQIAGVNYSGAVRAFAPLTGRLLWQTAAEGPVLGAPTYADGLIAVASGSWFTILSATNGSLLYRWNASATLWSTPAIVDGAVYLGTGSGKMVAFALPGGLVKRPSAVARDGPGPTSPPVARLAPWAVRAPGTRSRRLTASSGGPIPSGRAFRRT